MSTSVLPPGKKPFSVSLSVILLLLFPAFGFCVLFWPTTLDHRTVYDMEGRYLPANSLKQLALAMHAYEEANGRLPPSAVISKDGVPLLS